ncbi:TetR/AcrR family transcriptional regulator [Mycobacterium sp. URHB0021]|jgi:AcrR family transcriptional regulator
MPPASRTRRAGGSRRSAVLDAVVEVLAERGYENTRFTDVAAASGVAISTLQNYFGSREDMLIEAMRQATDRELLALEAVADAESDPWNRLVALINRNLNMPARTLALMIEFWRSGIRDAELRDYGEENWRRYGESFVRTVVDGRKAGVFAGASDPEDVVNLLLASLAGAMVPRVLHFATPSADRFRDGLLRQAAAMLGHTEKQPRTRPKKASR